MKLKFLYNLIRYNKEELKSSYFYIFIIVFLFCIFFYQQSDQEEIPGLFFKASDPETLIKKEKELLARVEGNFLNPYLIDSTINNHFQIPKFWKNESENILKRDDYALYNFFMERKNVYDKQYVEMSNYALGIINLKLDSLYPAEKNFKKLRNGKYPFLDYYKGQLYLSLGDTLKAEKHLISAISRKDIYQTRSMEILSACYFRQEMFDKIVDFFTYKEVASLFSPDQIIRVYYEKLHPFYLIFSLHKKYFYDVELLYVLGSLLITMCWIYYLSRIDVFHSYTIWRGLLAIVSGAIAVYLNIIVHTILEPLQHYIASDSFLYFFVFAGVVEEALKVMCVVVCLLAFKIRNNDVLSIFFTGCYVALGFSFLENIIHFQRNFEEGLFIRCMTAVPGHIINTSIVCYAFVLKQSKINSKPLVLILLPLLFCAAFLHGIYNYLAIQNLFSLFVLFLIIAFNIWVIIINNTINISAAFTYKVFPDLNKIKYVFFTFLLSIFIFQQLIIYSGQRFLDISLQQTGVIIFSVLASYFVSWKLSNIDLIKNYMHSYFSRSQVFIEEKTQSALLHYSSQLMVGSIIPHNIVYHKIQVKILNEDNTSSAIYRGKITSRMIVIDHADELNPYWFSIQVEGNSAIEKSKEFLFHFCRETPHFGRNAVNKIVLFHMPDANLKVDYYRSSDLHFYKNGEMILI